MNLYELTRALPGVQLRLSADGEGVEAALRAYERQYRTEAKRSGPNIFVWLLDGNTPGPRYFSVPDQLRQFKFEWLVTLREEVMGFQTSGRDSPYGRAVFIPHTGGEPLRPFGRERGSASFSGRSLLVERLSWVKPSHGGPPPGICRVGLHTVAVSLRPRFRHSREEREECDLPMESPYAFEVKVDDQGEGITLQLDLTREGGIEQVVQPTSQGSFKPTMGWAQLSAARQAAFQKLLCGEHLEDYRLDSHERWSRFNDRFGDDPIWTIPADNQAWRDQNRDKPRWQWGPEPREQRCQGILGLDGLPVRKPQTCGHLHFAQGVDPAHQESQEEEDGYQSRWDDDDRW